MKQLIIADTCRYFFALFFALWVCAVLPGSALAEPSVGIVSSMDGDVQIINADSKAIDFGDDLVRHDKIRVGAGSSLMLTYYIGCRQEWFSGDTVIEVGKTQSNIVSGKLEKSELFDCEVPSVVLSNNDSFKKAAFHFRGITTVGKKNKQQPMALIEDKKSKSWRVDEDEASIDDVKFKLWTAKINNRYYRSGEHIIIYFVANKDAYLSLDYYQADGNVVHLIPNIFEDKQRIKGGQIYVVGGNKSKLKLIVEHPYGEETITALVSVAPLTKELVSLEIIESADSYTNKKSKILSAENKVAEYALSIWSTP